MSAAWSALDRHIDLTGLTRYSMRLHAAASAVTQVATWQLRQQGADVADKAGAGVILFYRGTPNIAVEWLELFVQVGKRCPDEHVHAPQEMVLRDAIFETKRVEQSALISPPPPHHRPVPPVADLVSRRNHCSTGITTPLSTPSVINGGQCLPDREKRR